MHPVNGSNDHEQQNVSSSGLDVTGVDPDDLALWVAAPQLRVVTDRRLGKTTPSWVVQLAN